MLTLILALAPVLAQTPAALPDGRRLAEGQACYTLTMRQGDVSQPVGVTWQRIRRSERDGRPVLEIVVHQLVNGGAFDMRDEFVVDAATLRPLSLVNRRNGAVHVRAEYRDDRIIGEKTGADGAATPIAVALDGPVWDGNLFGLTFAALPLAEGAAFTLPFWQYDKGFGRFSVRVVGVGTAATPSGPVEAWVVDAGPEDRPPLRYLIGRADQAELGYSAPQGDQTPGGDCSAIEGAR